MRNGFFTYHPIVNILFFIVVIGAGMFIMHPIVLLMGFAGALTYMFMILETKIVLASTVGAVIITTVSLIVNVLVNSEGNTVLYSTKHMVITFESAAFGILAGLMLVVIMMWFICFGKIITSDKLMFLLGRILPSTTLVFTMVMRFLPDYKFQTNKILQAQKCIGRDVSCGTLREKIRHGAKLLAIMFTWALENSIGTVDSMKARGYGIKERTSFAIYRFDGRDGLALTAILIMTVIIMAAVITGRFQMSFYPVITLAELDLPGILAFTSYGVLCFMPVIIEVKEAVLWKYLQSKI